MLLSAKQRIARSRYNLSTGQAERAEHESLADRFSREFMEFFAAVPVGDPLWLSLEQQAVRSLLLDAYRNNTLTGNHAGMQYRSEKFTHRHFEVGTPFGSNMTIEKLIGLEKTDGHAQLSVRLRISDAWPMSVMYHGDNGTLKDASYVTFHFLPKIPQDLQDLLKIYSATDLRKMDLNISSDGKKITEQITLHKLTQDIDYAASYHHVGGFYSDIAASDCFVFACNTKLHQNFLYRPKLSFELSASSTTR